MHLIEIRFDCADIRTSNRPVSENRFPENVYFLFDFGFSWTTENKIAKNSFIATCSFNINFKTCC